MKNDKVIMEKGNNCGDVSRREFFGKAAKTTVAGILMAATGGILTNPNIALADGQYYWTSQNPKPTILPRSAWGAAPPKITLRLRNTSTIASTNLIFHHSGSLTFQSTDYETCINKIYQVQFTQMLGVYDDIAYHYIIDPAGRIFQGRDSSSIGGHLTGYNDNIGIMLLGNYDNQSVNSNQMTAIKNLSAWRIASQGIWKTNTFGHQNFGSSACPGASLQTYVTGALRTYLTSAIY